MEIFGEVMFNMCLIVLCGALGGTACVLIGLFIKEFWKGGKSNGSK